MSRVSTRWLRHVHGHHKIQDNIKIGPGSYVLKGFEACTPGAEGALLLTVLSIVPCPIQEVLEEFAFSWADNSVRNDGWEQFV